MQTLQHHLNERQLWRPSKIKLNGSNVGVSGRTAKNEKAAAFDLPNPKAACQLTPTFKSLEPSEANAESGQSVNANVADISARCQTTFGGEADGLSVGS